MSKESKGLMQTDGPGLWLAFHTMSLVSVTREASWFLIFFIKNTILRLKCPVCKGHALNYLKKYPPELRMGYLFEWTVDFHNDVNTRNDKKVWGYYQARNYYSMLVYRIPNDENGNGTPKKKSKNSSACGV